MTPRLGIRLLSLCGSLVTCLAHAEPAQQSFNAYGQLTYISSWKAPFSADYSNLNGSRHSLSASGEHSFTATATLYLGAAPWQAAEVYFVPEVISSRPLSDLVGLGASIQNAELQKQGELKPSLYVSRLYLAQTINLGGPVTDRQSGPMQLGKTLSSRRLLIGLGNFSVLDFFERNRVLGDPRRNFLSLAFLSHGAFDFAADARGYSWGGVLEVYFDDWAARFARLAVPRQPNQLALDPEIFEHYGDQLEFEHVHRVLGLPGAVRLLAYRNRAVMARFSEASQAQQRDPSRNAAACEAFNYGSTNAAAPDLCWARRPNTKVGLGVSFEQMLTRDVGAFARAMVADGHTEVYSYTSSDRSAALGAVVRGRPWRRPNDVLGAAYAASWISASHAQYLERGGIDGFIGDGALTRGAEQVLELFYSVGVANWLWVSADYQHIANPGYNVDRGPVNLLSGRLHAEF